MLWSWYQTPRLRRTVCSEGCSQISHVQLDRAGRCVPGGYCYQRPLALAMSEWYWRGSLPLAPPSRKEVRALAGSKSFLRFLFSSREREREWLGAQWRSSITYRTWKDSSENGDTGFGGKVKSGSKRKSFSCQSRHFWNAKKSDINGACC